MVTADTITDELIRELRQHAADEIDHENKWWHEHRRLWTASGQRNHDLLIIDQKRVVQTCDVALTDIALVSTGKQSDAMTARADARARCAEILNARSEGK